MANNEKVSGTANNSTRTAPIAPYFTLKSGENEFKVAIFAGVFAGNQGFGHCTSYVLKAATPSAAIRTATRMYERRANALPVTEARIIYPAGSNCLTYIPE